MSRLEHVVAVGHGVKAPREAETDTSTLFDLFYKDAKGDFHPMPAKYDDCEKFVSQRRPTVTKPAPELPTFDFVLARAKINGDDLVGLETMLEESRGFVPKTRASASQGAWLLKHAMEHYKVDAVKLLLDRFAVTEQMRNELLYAAGKMQEPYEPLTFAASWYKTNLDAGRFRGWDAMLDICIQLLEKEFPRSARFEEIIETLRAEHQRDGLVRAADYVK